MTDRTPQPSPAVPGLDDTCRKVQWRLRFQRAVRLMTPTGAAALGSAGVAILLGRLRWLDTGDETLWLCGVGIALALAALRGVTRRVTALEAAQRLDQAGGLYDRLGSALAFSRLEQRTPMQAAAIADARRFVGDTSPSDAAPWRRPAGLRWLTVGLALTVAGLITYVPVPPLQAAGLVALQPLAVPERPKPALTPDERARLVDEQARLEDETRRSTDPRVSAWIKELNELLRALHAGRVTPTQAHAAIARLEQARAALARTLGDDAEALAAHAQKAAKKTKSRAKRPVSPMLQALRAQRWQEAAEALEHLAGRVETGDLSKRERKRAGRDLAKLADRLKTERQKNRAQLQKERDRLKKKQAKEKDRFSKRDRDRLKKTKRQLERLERQREQAGEMRRQLERLQRGLDKGAAELLRRLAEQKNSMSADELRKAAEMLRRMSKSTQGRQQMKAADGRLIDLKELLRRASKRGKGGKDGEMERFLVLARGGDKPGGKTKPGSDEGKGGKSGEGKDITMLTPGSKGAGNVDLIMPGQGSSSTGSGGGGPGDEAGDGVGDGHDPNLLGQKTASDVKTVEHQVTGREGEGSSKSRVVFAAAKKGFTSRAWGAVHQDYSVVVEDALDAATIPAGKRRYVRRYFELIRPR